MTPRAWFPLILRAGPAVAALWLGAPAADASGEGETVLDVRENAPSSSRACQACHVDIYAAWSRSLHAVSLRNETFLDSYALARSAYGAAESKLCLECHAPFASHLDDEGLFQAISWEGVGCDYCHSFTSVEQVGGNYRAVVAAGGPKMGPIADAEEIGHEVAYSPLHEQSLTCAPCHEYVNPAGVKVLSTYTEWLESPQAGRGENCQTCHMAEVRANVVDPKVARLESIPVNLHEMPGGHSTSTLNRAIHVSMRPERDGHGVTVNLTLENRGAGHMVPTGAASRRIELELVAEVEGGQRYEETRSYGRVLGDEKGDAVLQDSRLFLETSQVLEDTRIAPGESREEVFRFPAASGRTVQLRLRLSYAHRPFGTDERETRIVWHSLNRTIRGT